MFIINVTRISKSPNKKTQPATRNFRLQHTSKNINSVKLGVLCGESKIKNHEKRNLAENRPHRHHDPDGHRYNLRRIVMHGTLNKKAQKNGNPELGVVVFL